MEGIKKIFFYLKPYRKTILLLGVLSTTAAFVEAIVPYVTGNLIDSLVAFNTNFLGILAVWFAIKILADLLTWRIGVQNDRFGTIVEADYTIKGFGTILEFPLKFYKNHKSGDIEDRILRAAKSLTDIVSQIMIDLAPQFLSMLFALSFIFFIHARFGFVILMGIIFYTLLIWKVSPVLVKLYGIMWQTYHEAYGDAFDTVANITAVKQATAEKLEQEKLYQNFRLKSAPLWTKIFSMWQQLSFYQRIIITMIQLFIFFYSYSLIQQGQITIGQLVAINAYSAMIFGPFVILARNWHMVQNGLVSLKTAEEILSYPKEEYIPQNVVTLNRMQGDVSFKEVSFQYAATEPFVLQDITFDVKAGSKIAIVGKSGEGKSTLVDLISRYDKPYAGCILIDGVDMNMLALRQLRSQIGVVPQEIVLFNDTIKNNIRYGRPQATQKEVETAAYIAHAEEFIQKFPHAYDQLVGERGLKLSVGQKQRVAIARAVLKNPRILILDEPTSALDARLENLLQDSLEKLMQGRTTFIIAHRLSTIKSADMILVLEGGRIAERGTHEELLKKRKGIYSHLYTLQFGETI